METVYDWITVAIFAGLIVLFLNRSSTGKGEEKKDPLLAYLAAGAGCALGNYLGNEGQSIAASAILATTVVFIMVVLKPFQAWPKA